MNDKLDLQSTDITSLNIEKIGALFPNCVTETDEGKKIDFDLLKQELSAEIIEGNKERYRLEWPGKREAIVTANIPTNKTLRPVREDSVDFDTTGNIYIEGDNLEVLKLLQESYLNKIKMIYIDPPYNTGKDFVYKDNFAKASEEELLESGQKDEYNQKLVANPETNGRYHSDWLSMMYPRLKLARNLLTEDGVIFISIDDNEVHNLRKICDEIFGEGNFMANIVWQKKFSRSNDATYFSTMHDHILCYARNNILDNKNGWKIGLLPRGEEIPKGYSNPDNDSRGIWTSVALQAKSGSDKSKYEIITPTGRVCLPPNGRYWSVSKESYEKLLSENRIWFGVEGNGTPRQKTFLSEVQEGLRPNTILFHSEVGHNQEGKQETKNIFENIGVFDGPKPVKLLKHLSLITNLKTDSIILDFFSGSATTAHATMQLNAEDGGNRKYIMVQLPETTDEKSEAYKAGYKNICEIGKERIRRAANKIKEETGADIDYGFRVYRLDSSNMQDVYYKPQDYNQGTLDLFADNVKENRTAEDLVTQVMLDWGLPLSLPIERKTIAGKEVYTVAGDSLYCCFDKGIDEAFAKAIAAEKPLRIVFRDKGFKDDTAKENVKQLLKQLSAESEMRVI
ncbi:MAG: site-specific DNA-methyltransferase [Flavobacterium lindanitolerans]|uniref:site-specific DNA-methyltransferase n=1 Tax=Flavobacterium lindanitolerans TaxID=428988 RepID=UPI001A38DAFD|nr:site-specific DNA-methyltransferase [Flavobacterium lindanitolerans]MBL7869738.1 site-specific DNA-methyltransferase [Flavobacterium lindanitolerans]